MNPFQKPEEVDTQVALQVQQMMDNQLETQGKIMFYDAMEQMEKAIEQKKVKLAKVLAYHITRLLLKSSMAEQERNFIIIGFQDEIAKISSDKHKC